MTIDSQLFLLWILSTSWSLDMIGQWLYPNDFIDCPAQKRQVVLVAERSEGDCLRHTFDVILVTPEKLFQGRGMATVATQLIINNSQETWAC